MRMTDPDGRRKWDRWLSLWPVAVGFCLNFVSMPGASAQQPITLAWPVACKIGETCFVQNFVDHDAGDAARDFTCGSRTYDGHDGTDIRLVDMQSEQTGVAVLAAADGRVARARDGVSDISVRVTGVAAVAGKECGNGLVIEHGGGWSTQYCHLKMGSVVVAPGQMVKTGTPLGQVGLSGETEFPHLHLTVRHNGTTVDPFAFDEPSDACSGGRSLWDAKLSEALAYRDREILNFGFSEITPTMENIESGIVHLRTPGPRSGELVAYVRAIGLRKGDEQIISVTYPDGRLLAEYKVPALEADKAQFFAIAGQRRKENDWPAGTYATIFRVTNNGQPVLSKTFSLTVP
jgi:Peptidase family M23